VEEAVVLPGAGDYEGRLIAYIRYTEKSQPQEDYVRQCLMRVLPLYMVPDIYIPLAAFPLTNSGKINRRALPPPTAANIKHAEYIAPHTQGEQVVATIWRELLKADVVGASDNFFELGGNSLLALQVLAAIEKATSIRLPVSALFEFPTIEKLAGLLKEDRKLSKIKSLVPVKTGGSKKPLYIVSGLNGTAFAFVAFANMLDADQPVFVLQEPQEISEMEEFPTDVEGIAATYIAQITAQNPDGPYAIVGHSFGGIIAFEMAKQLENMGKDVRLLALMDTYAYQRKDDQQGIASKLHGVKEGIQNIFFKLSKNAKLLVLEPALAFRYRRSSFVRLTNSLKQKFNLGKNNNAEVYEFSEKVTQLYKAANKKYKITPYNRHMVLYRAKIASYRRKDYKYLGWKPYAASLKVYSVKGDHLSMVGSKGFANLVQENLNRYLHRNQ
jgi:thioesterase domain-containing protein/acyl carrier protein